MMPIISSYAGRSTPAPPSTRITVTAKLADLESDGTTDADFARQQFADAIRISMQPMTASKYRPLAMAGAIGGLIGLALGMGLSLLGIYIGVRKG